MLTVNTEPIRTTTTHTTALANSISRIFHDGDSDAHSTFLELVIRVIFFLLNLLSNAVMWAFFTRALTAGPSTTKVSVINTASNFIITALLGAVVFAETVGSWWWLGAVMMGSGCVLVGMSHG